jgi:hypothetical protein
MNAYITKQEYHDATITDRGHNNILREKPSQQGHDY